MKIKARIAPQECPKKFWQKTTEVKAPEDLPWEDLKTGRAKDHDAKRKMIEIYNTIYMTNYSPNTSCGSCITTCFDAIKNLYKKYKK